MRRIDRAMLLTMLASVGTAAADPCLLEPAELQTATGHQFDTGTPGTDIATQEPLCTYRETNNPKRYVMVRILTEKAPRRFESNKRLVSVGNDPIELDGIGDAAFYSGTTAGVLVGEKAIVLSTLRRASDPKIAREAVVELLRKATQRLERI